MFCDVNVEKQLRDSSPQQSSSDTTVDHEQLRLLLIDIKKTNELTSKREANALRKYEAKIEKVQAMYQGYLTSAFSA